MSRKTNLRGVKLGLIILFASVSQVSAHEKWFHETENYNLRWNLFFRLMPLIFFTAIMFDNYFCRILVA